MIFETKTKRVQRIELGLVTMAEAAREMGISQALLRWRVKHGHCPAAVHQYGKSPKRYYLRAEVERMKC